MLHTAYPYMLDIGRVGGLVKSLSELGDSIVSAIWVMDFLVFLFLDTIV